MLLQKIFLSVCMILSLKLSIAQCSLCTKTAQQLGSKPSQGMNAGVLYMMLIVAGIIGYIVYRLKKNKTFD